MSDLLPERVDTSKIVALRDRADAVVEWAANADDPIALWDNLECRDRAKVELGYWMTAIIVEAALIESEPLPVLVVKRRGKAAEQAYVVLELATFARLIADEATVLS